MRGRLGLDLRRARLQLRAGDIEGAQVRCADGMTQAAERDEEELGCELAILAGDIEQAHGTLERGLVHHHDAAKRGERLNRSDLVARAWLGVALVHVRRHHFDEAVEAAKLASEAADRTHDPGLRAEASRALGNAHLIAGRRGPALRIYRRTVKIARESGALESEGKALNNLGTASHGMGRVRSAIAAYRRSIELKERVGARASALLTWASMSGLLNVLGEHDEAWSAQQRVLDDASSGPVATALAWSNRGDLLAIRGDLDTAIDAYERANGMYRDIGMHQLRTHALTGNVRVRLMRRAAEDAELAAERLADLSRVADGSRNPEDMRRLSTTRAMHFEARGERARALVDARSAAKMLGSDTIYEDVFGSAVDARFMVALICARSGRAFARPLRAAHALLTRRIDALDEADDRPRFVERHPLHRALLADRLDTPVGTTWLP